LKLKGYRVTACERFRHLPRQLLAGAYPFFPSILSLVSRKFHFLILSRFSLNSCYTEAAELVLIKLSTHYHSFHTLQPDIANDISSVYTTDCGFLVEVITCEHRRYGQSAGNQEFIACQDSSI
jgi:hypothetical protein